MFLLGFPEGDFLVAVVEFQNIGKIFEWGVGGIV